MTTQPPEVTVTTSHDLSDWRTAHEDNVPGPELNRIRARVAAARQRGENDALVAVVLDEASSWRVRALEAEATLGALTARHRLCSECGGTRIGCLAAPVKCCPACRHPQAVA